MAESKVRTEREDMALSFLGLRIAAGLPVQKTRAEFIRCLHQADVALQTLADDRAGKLKQDESKRDKFADCSAPNLSSDSPHNLVARMHVDRKGVRTPGNLVAVAKIHAWLKANPEPVAAGVADIAGAIETFVERFQGATGYKWDLPTIHIAQQIFPHYVAA